jgi:AcrR family transcriptional regulator
VPKKPGSTKARILDAAKELFIRQGFKGTSTRQIARAAAVSEMTVFRQFPSKERIFREVVEPLVSFVDNLHVSGAESASELANELLSQRLAFLREEHGLVRLVLMESYLAEMSFNPIMETAGKIRKMFAAIDPVKADLYLRLMMGFILTCIFLPDECEGSAVQLDQIIRLFE